MYCDSGVTKREEFFGWCLDLIVTTTDVPMAWDLVAGALQDQTTIHELCSTLPAGSIVLGDKGARAAVDATTIGAETTVGYVAQHKANIRPNRWEERWLLRIHRNQVKARTNPGFALKVHVAIVALVLRNWN